MLHVVTMRLIYTVFQKSNAKIQITITTAHLIRIKYPLSGFNYHLFEVNVANFNKIHRTVSKQQLFKNSRSLRGYLILIRYAVVGDLNFGVTFLEHSVLINYSVIYNTVFSLPYLAALFVRLLSPNLLKSFLNARAAFRRLKRKQLNNAEDSPTALTAASQLGS